MTYLLDTHTFLWAIGEATKLSKRVASLIVEEDSDLMISIVSLWEIAIKVEVGKLDLPATPEYFDVNMTGIGIRRVLSIDQAHVFATLSLPRVHKDPFDRMLAAQCIVEKMTLVTSDKIFRKYPIDTIW
jgi:PIN domain nuclease of toxin-antitoxin system